MRLLGESSYFGIKHFEAENVKQLILTLLSKSNIAALFYGIHTRTMPCIHNKLDLVWEPHRTYWSNELQIKCQLYKHLQA